jgi:hypothetical protein
LKRYFGTSTLAMLRTLRALGFISKAQLDEFAQTDPGPREKEIFGNRADDGEGRGIWSGRLRKRTQPSDRFKLLQQEAARKVSREQAAPRPIQPTLPDTEVVP